MTAWRQQIDNNVIEPTSIHGLPNGQFPDSALTPVHDANGRQIGRLCPEAARAWDAMAHAAGADRITLRATSSADTYRPLAIQQQIFTDRYRSTDQGNGSRVCSGKRWYQRPHTATAACPGTSNHGRGLAVDVQDAQGATLAWLEQHAKDYGFQWELESEPWHIHYMPGDHTPPAVTSAPPGPSSPDPSEEDDMVLIQVTAGADKDKVFLVVGNTRRQQDKTSADRLIHAGVRYLMMDDIAWEQITLGTDLAGAPKG